MGCQETEDGGKVRGRTAWGYTLKLTRAACKAASDSSSSTHQPLAMAMAMQQQQAWQPLQQASLYVIITM
jgi:hypothetical protein